VALPDENVRRIAAWQAQRNMLAIPGIDDVAGDVAAVRRAFPDSPPPAPSSFDIEEIRALTHLDSGQARVND
jgi:hypothetical protein